MIFRPRDYFGYLQEYYGETYLQCIRFYLCFRLIKAVGVPVTSESNMRFILRKRETYKDIEKMFPHDLYEFMSH